MNYRWAEARDWPGIIEFLGDTGYFSPVDPSSLGGHWIIAESQGKVCGTAWFFGEPPHIYVDYWAARYPRVGAHLLGLLHQFCREHGVRYVRGIVAADNKNAMRLARDGFGVVLDPQPYCMIFREI